MPILSVKGLKVVVGGRVLLEHVSLTVDRGEIVALIGPNGAGKTTLLKAILGLIPLTAGEVLLFGKPLNMLGPNRDRLGYVPQNMELDRSVPITVEELIGVYTPRRYLGPGAIRRALAEVDAERLARQRVGALSGGELQRVLIAMSLLRDPALLFLDEPATGVDREGQKLLYDTLEHLRSERGIAVLMVSHDFSVVYRHASRVVCINRRLMCAGIPSEVLTEETLEHLYGHEAALYEHHD
ncbi:MAG: metal ABC transporter ATP-binding protein [Chthonomonadales bacterium]